MLSTFFKQQRKIGTPTTMIAPKRKQKGKNPKKVYDTYLRATMQLDVFALQKFRDLRETQHGEN
jgi:hypothetical protein